MNLSQYAGAIAIASCLFSAGCLGTTDGLEAEALEEPRLGALFVSNGSHGSNGLHPADFHPNAAHLHAITSSRLVAPGPLGANNNPTPLYPNIHNNILSSPLFSSFGGSETFRYAVQCVVPHPHILDNPILNPNLNQEDYEGYGILTSTTGWLTAGIPASAVSVRQDLFACMIAHLNPTSTTVPIRLTGEKVANVTGNPDLFTFQEALWIARETPGTSSYRYMAWALPDLKDRCLSETSLWLKDRVCSQSPMECSVDVGEDVTKDCIQGANGNYTCKGLPAIKTWLETASVGILYPSCVQ